jgi:lipopolysaccharide export system ATP-binding protein
MGTQVEDLALTEKEKDQLPSAGSVLAGRHTQPTPSAHALAAFNLQKTYGRRRVVDDVSLHVEKARSLVSWARNGAGKTTTFYMIVGLEHPDSGAVQLGERDVTKLPMYLRARLGLGYLPQEPSVFRKMTAAQNILAVLETMGMRRRERLTRLEELLEEFGIAHVRNTRA